MRCIWTTLPTLPVEPNALQTIQIDALQTPCVDHVVRRVRARAVERRCPAEAAELVECPLSTELVRHKGILALEKAESIGRDHVMKVTLAAADRAIAFANAVKVGSNLELHAAAMTRTTVGSDFICEGHGRPPLTRQAFPRTPSTTGISRLARRRICARSRACHRRLCGTR